MTRNQDAQCHISKSDILLYHGMVAWQGISSLKVSCKGAVVSLKLTIPLHGELLKLFRKSGMIKIRRLLESHGNTIYLRPQKIVVWSTYFPTVSILNIPIREIGCHIIYSRYNSKEKCNLRSKYFKYFHATATALWSSSSAQSSELNSISFITKVSLFGHFF